MALTTTKGGIISKGVKVISIKIDEDFIENNLIDLPFIYYYKSKEPITAITYNWTTSDGTNRAVEVRSSKYGIPTPYEYDVLLALFRLYIKQHNNKIICISEEDTSEFDALDNTVSFSYRELIKEMGYKSYSNVLKTKVEKAIETLCDTNIYNTARGGLYNPFTKEYITDSKFQVGILDGYKTYNYITLKDEHGNVVLDENGQPIMKLDKNSIKDKCAVRIDRFFLKNLYYGNGKISDKNLRLSLKNDVARKVYLILNKWRNNRSEMFLKFETLYHRIPLNNEKSDYYRKRRVMDSLEELKNKGFIADYEKRKEGVNIIFNQEEKRLIAPKNDILSKYNSYEELLNGFKTHGIDDKSIAKYLKLHQIPYYQALLRLVEDKIDKIDNVKSYVLKGLIDEYENIDKKYYNNI